MEFKAHYAIVWKENPQVENTADGSQYSQESASLQSHPNARPCYDQRGQKSHLRLYRLQLARQMIKSRTVQLEQDWTSIVYFEELPEGNLFYAWKKQKKKKQHGHACRVASELCKPKSCPRTLDSIQTVKCGDGNVIIWGFFAAKGPGHLQSLGPP